MDHGTEVVGVAQSMKFLGDYHVDDLAERLRRYVGSAVWPQDGEVDAETWERTIDSLTDIGLLDRSVSAETLEPI